MLKVAVVLSTLAITVMASIQSFSFYQAQQDRAAVISVANQVLENLKQEQIKHQERIEMEARADAALAACMDGITLDFDCLEKHGF